MLNTQCDVQAALTAVPLKFPSPPAPASDNRPATESEKVKVVLEDRDIVRAKARGQRGNCFKVLKSGCGVTHAFSPNK
jgi:hypothetical protein